MVTNIFRFVSVKSVVCFAAEWSLFTAICILSSIDFVQAFLGELFFIFLNSQLTGMVYQDNT